MDNIACSLLDSVERNKDAAALIVPHGARRIWTFAEVERQVASYCQALSHAGIRRGDRVILMVKPSMEFVSLAFALFSIGAPVILIDPGMGYKNLLKCIGSVRPEAFVGIPKAHLFRKLFPAPFKNVRVNICVGPSFGVLGTSLNSILSYEDDMVVEPIVPGEDELAAIIFTTGSTGPPKGVQYSHAVFQAQLEMIRDYYGIKAGDLDQPAFPLFALFSMGLGATAVIPDMDPTKPAQVDPQKFIQTILAHKVTYSFGSPAIWDVVSRYCQEKGIVLPTVRTVLMAGAPVPGDLVQRVRACISDKGEVHTPYGATECLPIASMSGSEIVASTWTMTQSGKGTCVGRSLPGIKIQIIAPVDGPIRSYDEADVLPIGMTGEIIVQGKVVTKAYDSNNKENLLAKIHCSDGGFWHRVGDMGYLDNEGRLWFCGRKAHRVCSAQGPMYSVCCEAVFNTHADVKRSALVGVGAKGEQIPVLIVELNKKGVIAQQLFGQLASIADKYEHTRDIHHFMINPSFPVDIRHNAKIFREKLAVWAENKGLDSSYSSQL